MKILHKKENLAQEAGAYLSNLIKESAQKPILLLLSGGSAFSILEHINTDILNDGTTITVLDERYSHNTKINNFTRFTQTDFYKKALSHGASFIDTRPRGDESMEDLANRLEESLRLWEGNNLDGIVIAVVGIGTDGHTAGIMSYRENKNLYEELFENKQKWVVGYDARDKNQYPQRVTVTNTFFRTMINEAIVFISGANKEMALRDTLAEEGSLHQTPARIIKEMKNVALFTDIDIK